MPDNKLIYKEFEMLYNLLRPMFYVVGALLKLAGKYAGEYKLYLLGHYMQGTGKTVGLPDDLAMCAKLGASLYHETDYLYVTDYRGTDLYHCVGKAFVRWLDTNTLELSDYYEFYPWCGKRKHFSGCACDTKVWNSVNVSKVLCYPNKHERLLKLAKKLLSRCDEYWCPHLIKSELLSISIEICLDAVTFECFVSDRFFTYVGRPFGIYHIYKYKDGV